MASTQLSDAVIPEVYLSYTSVDSPELTKFYESGVAVTNEALMQAFEKVPGGNITHIPFWKDLDATAEPNYSTDNPADIATPDKTSADYMETRIADVNKGFSSADLVAQLAGSDPMQHIRDRFESFWAKQWQRRLIAVCKGLLLENIADDSGDMVIDVSQETIVGLSDANLFGRKTFTAAAFTLGDHFGELVAIAVHSIVYKRMVDNDDITFVPPSVPHPNLSLAAQAVPTYLGKTVIVDDGMPVVAGSTSGFKYTSILFGAGAIGYANGVPQHPVEVYRRPDEGNGGGVEQLWERKRIIIHPFGYRFTSNSVAGQSATNAEMALATNWDRRIERKNVPIAFMVTNG